MPPPSLRRLEGKIALITGAGSGIGTACCLLFGREGAGIAAADLALESAQSTVSDAAAQGSKAAAFRVDVTQRNDVDKLFADVIARFGRIDIVVSCAGVTARNADPSWDWERVWDFIMAVNMKGTFLVSKAAIEHMAPRGSGVIVNLASIYGLVGRPEGLGSGLDAYLHSKGGVAQLTRDMAVHFAKNGVRVNALCPGFTYTALTKKLTDDPAMLKYLVDRHPMGRLAQPEEIARAALFLASDEASYITGACLPVDGGYTAQ